MWQQPNIIAALIVAASVLFYGYELGKGQARYHISASGNDQTVWRVDVKTGRVSMCGTMVGGAAFSQMDSAQTKAMMGLTKDTPKEEAEKIIRDWQQINAASKPSCGEWSGGD